mmetsp:Transcript_152193/g.386737  ORF Transcript_152193/g.386737 Transcript_152193/m.386737 type:complete len:273 (-) Transcript_152193:117-935(-)
MAAAAVATAPGEATSADAVAVAAAAEEAPLVAPSGSVASATAATAADEAPLVSTDTSPRGSPTKRLASEAGFGGGSGRSSGSSGGGRSAAASAAKAARLSALAAAGAAAAAAAAAVAKRQQSPTTPTRRPKGTHGEEAESPVKEKLPAKKEVLPWERTLKDELKRSSSSTSNLGTRMDWRRKFKDGQRFPTPPVAEATRAFYESLIEENPDSKIAIKYCVEYGVLPMEEHKKAYKKYKKLREKGSFSTAAMVKKALQRKYDKLGKDGQPRQR